VDSLSVMRCRMLRQATRQTWKPAMARVCFEAILFYLTGTTGFVFPEHLLELLGCHKQYDLQRLGLDQINEMLSIPVAELSSDSIHARLGRFFNQRMEEIGSVQETISRHIKKSQGYGCLSIFVVIMVTFASFSFLK